MSGFFKKLGFGLKKTSQNLSQGIADIFTKESLSDDVVTDLEELLYTADVGVKATTEIIEKFSARRFEKGSDIIKIKEELCSDIVNILKPSEQELVIDKNKKPYVILMVGVNGAGKTTTIGKLGKKFAEQGYKVSFIAADTFRAAAVEQLAVWGSRNNLRVFSGAAGCDSAGLCYDGLKEAEKQGDDIVFIDTAGRLQNKKGLMEELQKIVRVIKKVFPEAPHKTLITIDATTGQNGLDQVKTFKELVDVNGVVVTKLDGSSKGGILVAIASEIGIPIHFVGVGEQVEDMDIFKAEDFAKGLLDL
ncbi:MAG: signal recognition particle-docking protein FtsY [Acetobacter sp.]|nr:signal recognition particle-docking protein FtsY [Acetobacter sp.]